MRTLMLMLAFVAGFAGAAPTVTGSVSSSFSGTSGSVAVCNGVGDMIVVVVASPNTPSAGDLSFTTSEAGWVTELSAAPRDTPLAVFTKFSDGTETSLTVDIGVSANADATAFCVSGVTGLALKHSAGQSGLANPPKREVGTAGDRLMVAVGAWGGVAPVALPGGYGFPIDTGANLSLSFRSLVGVGDDPGPYSIGVVAKWHSVTLAIY